MSKTMEELAKAIENHNAQTAIAVFSRQEFAPGPLPFSWSGNRAVLVYDKDDPAELRAVLMCPPPGAQVFCVSLRSARPQLSEGAADFVDESGHVAGSVADLLRGRREAATSGLLPGERLAGPGQSGLDAPDVEGGSVGGKFPAADPPRPCVGELERVVVRAFTSRPKRPLLRRRTALGIELIDQLALVEERDDVTRARASESLSSFSASGGMPRTSGRPGGEIAGLGGGRLHAEHDADDRDRAAGDRPDRGEGQAPARLRA